MPTVVPIKDLRDTARFSELVENSPTPVTVTKNGYGCFVVMRVEDYDALAEEQAKGRLMSRIAIAERERSVKAGRDAFEHIGELRAKYGA